jgi:hypothetical protein
VPSTPSKRDWSFENHYDPETGELVLGVETQLQALLQRLAITSCTVGGTFGVVIEREEIPGTLPVEYQTVGARVQWQSFVPARRAAQTEPPPAPTPEAEAESPAADGETPEPAVA